MRISLGNCSPDQITCKDGQCIGKKHWLCDGNVCPYNRCDDNSDEDQQICGMPNPNKIEWECMFTFNHNYAGGGGGKEESQ